MKLGDTMKMDYGRRNREGITDGSDNTVDNRLTETQVKEPSGRFLLALPELITTPCIRKIYILSVGFANRPIYQGRYR